MLAKIASYTSGLPAAGRFTSTRTVRPTAPSVAGTDCGVGFVTRVSAALALSSFNGRGDFGLTVFGGVVAFVVAFVVGAGFNGSPWPESAAKVRNVDA